MKILARFRERRIFADMLRRNLFPKPYQLKTISGFASRDEEQQIRKEILIKLTNAMHRRQKPVTVDDSLRPSDQPPLEPALIVADLRKLDTGLTEEDAQL
jgi:hypothetical protein